MSPYEDGTDWHEIIYRGAESQQLDYKAAQDWNELSRVGRSKFARHAMAMANTRGGYIVVGVGEDANGNPVLRTGLTEKQAKSFDPSTVGQTINRYADPAVEFDIVRPEVDGKRYAILVIQRFNSLPHVCADSCEHELQRGVFYVRTPDARSRAAYRASELHEIVQRALRNQRQTLARMLRGVLYEGRQVAEPDAEAAFREQLSRCRSEVGRVLGAGPARRSVGLEFCAFPEAFRANRFELSELLRGVKSVILPPVSRFPFAEEGHVFLTNDSLRRQPQEGAEEFGVYWEIFRNGFVYYFGATGEADDKQVPYPLLTRRIVGACHGLGQIYADLGMEDELLTMVFRMTNAEGARLIDTGNGGDGYTCFIPEIEVEKRRTVADLVSGTAANAVKIIGELCERFNYMADGHGDLRPRLEDLLIRGRS